MSVVISSAIYWSDWPNATDTACDVRAKSNKAWISADGEIIAAGESRVVGTASITALRPTLPAITLPSTSAGLDDQTAKWTITLHRTGRAQAVSTVLADFPLPISFEPSVTWAQIKIHKNGKQPLRDTQTYTKTETDYQISLAMGNLNRASLGVLGRIETATIPADPLHPKAVLDEDPRIARATGTDVLVAGLPTTVLSALVAANSPIELIPADNNITGRLYPSNRVVGVSFDAQSENGADSGSFRYTIY